MTDAPPSPIRLALVLMTFALVCTALVVMTNRQTIPAIATAQHEAMMQQFAEIIPRDRFDNDAITDCIVISDIEWLGTERPLKLYRFRQQQQPVAVLLQAVAPDGYNGNIDLLIGIYHNEQLAGVRVSAHKETPGLGDKIERKKSDWIEAFKQLSLTSTPAEKWTVKKDGGAFDAFTGATITPRAVIKAVNKALIYHQQHRDAIYGEGQHCEADT